MKNPWEATKADLTQAVADIAGFDQAYDDCRVRLVDLLKKAVMLDQNRLTKFSVPSPAIANLATALAELDKGCVQMHTNNRMYSLREALEKDES